MIKFYYHPTPNPAKVALFLEEAGMPYEVIPVDTRKGEQHEAWFRAVNPNGKLPAIIDMDGVGGETRVFDSNAILLYLAEKCGQFLGKPEQRGELLSWLMFIASGLGPYSGQAVHFQRVAPEPKDYGVKRYRFEAERHYRILDEQLEGRTFFLGDEYTIIDMAAWGWIARHALVLGDGALDQFPNLKRWFAGMEARDAVARAKKVGSEHSFKQEMDEVAKRAMFPSLFAAQ
jgi:GST-like protein